MEDDKLSRIRRRVASPPVHKPLRNNPLQLAIHVVQNRRAGEQKSHWDNKQNTCIILNGNLLCLSCPSATFALQHGGFVPREWLAAKGLLPFLCVIKSPFRCCFHAGPKAIRYSVETTLEKSL